MTPAAPPSRASGASCYGDYAVSPDSTSSISSTPPGRRLAVEAPIGSQAVDSFQMSAQVATLLHHALKYDLERRQQQREQQLVPVKNFAALDVEIRRATNALLSQNLNWEGALDCFAMLVSALFTLYLPYLPVLEKSTPDAIGRDEELLTALAALRFAMQLSVDISCRLNDDIRSAPRPSLAVLCAPAAPTCYLVIVAFAGLRRIFPEERERCEHAIGEKFESLWLFSRRWGIAGESSLVFHNDSPLSPPLFFVCLAV